MAQDKKQDLKLDGKGALEIDYAALVAKARAKKSKASTPKPKKKRPKTRTPGA
jgi:hypothetical protein